MKGGGGGSTTPPLLFLNFSYFLSLAPAEVTGSRSGGCEEEQGGVRRCKEVWGVQAGGLSRRCEEVQGERRS